MNKVKIPLFHRIKKLLGAKYKLELYHITQKKSVYLYFFIFAMAKKANLYKWSALVSTRLSPSERDMEK